MPFRVLPLFSVLFALAHYAWPHDLFIVPERFRVAPGETIAVGLHNGRSFPESDSTAPVKRLREVQLRARNGAIAINSLRDVPNRSEGRVAVNGSGPLLLTARAEPNVVRLPAPDFESYLAQSGLTGVIEWRAKHGETKKPGRERCNKFAKSLIHSGAPAAVPLPEAGHTIEIVPEEDPALLKAGDAFSIRVLLRGLPAKGLQVDLSWAGEGGRLYETVGKTDDSGRISVPLGSPGLYRLHTIAMERTSDGYSADWESYWASLTFELR